MTAFTLDTSGYVEDVDPVTQEPVGMRWTDLDPFTQGYVEALFAEFEAENPPRFERHRLGFSDLSPEALALILKDCAAFQAHPISNARHPLGADAGRAFWESCQRGERPDIFPPLTASLGDDGKVHLKA